LAVITLTATMNLSNFNSWIACKIKSRWARVGISKLPGAIPTRKVPGLSRHERRNPVTIVREQLSRELTEKIAIRLLISAYPGFKQLMRQKRLFYRHLLNLRFSAKSKVIVRFRRARLLKLPTTMRSLSFFICLGFLVQITPLSSTLAASSCRQLIGQAKDAREVRADLFQAMLEANVRYPQTNQVIGLSVLEQYLRNPTELNETSAPLTRRETELMGERMNKIHEAYGIPVATEGYVTSRFIAQRVPLERLETLGNLSIGILPSTVSTLLAVIQPAKAESLRKLSLAQNYAGIFKEFMGVYTSPSREGKILRSFGPALRRVLESKKLRELCVNYRDTLGEGRKAGPNETLIRPPPKVAVRSRRLSFAIDQMLREFLAPLKLGDAFFEDFSHRFL
jgi:hypothetical protein